MIDRPEYFESVREKAAERWVQLENDPELAGPWHQLFKQVQSPRHVVSELLQNADDAGATEATIDIDNNEFIFSHNGNDFIEEHFISLCRFGYSNKRALHTIGFRGVGFKSLFSLDDEVRLITPTLSVAFYRRRFTEPVWIEQDKNMSGRTEVHVFIKGEHCQHELKKNLEEWVKSSASLLFFRSIRCLRIGQQEIRWISKGPGPINNSNWMMLSTNPEIKYLLLRSGAENFPNDALNEIRQERMISTEEETSFPPCHIEIILGMEGRLFVILPTGVKTNLPFACNAPFVQDPARIKIKDPETSPTNRWLLKRAGELAASGMLEWLHCKDLKIEKRCKAYALFPNMDCEGISLEDGCTRIIEEAFKGVIKNKKFLITENGALVAKRNCISIPSEILDIWTLKQIKNLFDENKRPILCHSISEIDREKLFKWDCYEWLDKNDILDVLESKHLPRPDTWRKLFVLWVYVSKDVIGYFHHHYHNQVQIIPVQGKDVLYAANDVVRLGEKKLLQSNDDWEFLSDHLLVINPNWLRFLNKQRQKAKLREDDELGDQVEQALEMLSVLEISESSDVSRVIAQVAVNMFSQNECPLKECIRIAQIAAKLGASTQKSFQFVTCDGSKKRIDQHILVDISEDLDQFIINEWYKKHFLHDDYWQEFISCKKSEWQQWIRSGRSGLLTFVPLVQLKKHIWNRGELQGLIRERNFDGNLIFSYQRDDFTIDDWDFDAEHWDYWKLLFEKDEEIWGHLFERILNQSKGYWSKTLSAKVWHNGTTRQQPVTQEDPISSWIAKFRSLPCLQDTRGHYRLPAELLRRTPETESLLEVEHFIRAEDDNEHTRPLLIKLGVRDTPTGPERLLDRLRALANIETSPLYEIEKWYYRLDKIITICSTDEFKQIKNAFLNDKIILTENLGWVNITEVFLDADEEDFPGAAIIHSSVCSLTLWRKIGVAERPTAKLALDWLKSIPSGQKFSQDELKRVRSLLPRFAERIWNECRHWLNLEGEWVSVDSLSFKLTMQSLIPWGNLFLPVKQKTADLQRLSTELCQRYPFSELSSLAASIEDHFQEGPLNLPDSEKKAWITFLGKGLQQITFDNEDEIRRIQDIAKRLTNTRWQIAKGLKTIPYIDGIPVGTPRSVDVLWKDEVLYNEDQPVAKMFKPIAQEIARPFERQDITEAIKACVERSSEFISEYLKTNFKLISPEELKPLKPLNTVKTIHDDEIANNNNKETHESALSKETSIDIKKTPTDVEKSDEVLAPIIVKSEIVHEDDEELEEVDSNILSKNKASLKYSKPQLIDQFAIARGYTKDNSDRFYHQDGSWIQKAKNGSFHWERYSSSGELLQSYWLKDHCIQRGSLQLDSEVWASCEKYPNKYTLLLTDQEKVPIELSGQRLCEMRDCGQLNLYPAKYRLVYNNNKDLDINE